MGCDYELKLQVRYGNYWVTIVDFGTKTGCGGYPLVDAYKKVAENKELNIKGDYGTQFRIVKSKYSKYRSSDYNDETSKMEGRKTIENIILGIEYIEDSSLIGHSNGLSKYVKPLPSSVFVSAIDEANAIELSNNGNNNKDSDDAILDEPPTKKRRKLTENSQTDASNKAEAEAEAENEENCHDYYYPFECEFLYYSIEQFESEYIKILKGLETEQMEQDKEMHELNRMLYTRMMTPVPMWCKLLKENGCLPVYDDDDDSEIWMDAAQDHINAVTNKIKKNQSNLGELYLTVIKDSMPHHINNDVIPNEIIKIIAEYSIPIPNDVRIAIKDDEGRSNLVRQGKFEQSISQGCCIM